MSRIGLKTKILLPIVLGAVSALGFCYRYVTQHGSYWYDQTLESALDLTAEMAVDTGLIALGLVSLIALTAAAWSLHHALRGLHQLLERVQRFADGDLAQPHLEVRSGDEIGRLSSGFNDLLNHIGGLVGQAEALVEDDLENSSLAKKIPGDLGDSLSAVADNMRRFARLAEGVARSDLEQIDGNRSLASSLNSLIRLIGEQENKIAQLEQELRRREAEAQVYDHEAQIQRKRDSVVLEQLTRSSSVLSGTVRQLSARSEELAERSLEQESVDLAAAAGGRLMDSSTAVSEHLDSLARLASLNTEELKRLANSITTVTQHSEQMNRFAGASTASVEELADALTQQADRTGNYSQSLPHMAEIGHKAGQLLRDAITGSKGIESQLVTLSGALDEMNRESEQINSLTAEIDDMADRVGLLALNAHIEAAKAGEDAGVAAIADEVRKLAKRTREAGANIDERLLTIRNETTKLSANLHAGTQEVGQGRELSARSSASLDQLTDGIENLAGLLEESNRATDDQTAGVEGLSYSSRAMGELTEQIQSAVGNQSEVMESLSRIANQMRQVVAQIAATAGEQSDNASQLASFIEEAADVSKQT